MGNEQELAQDEDASDTEALCESCGAAMCVDAGQRAVRCPFCDAPAVLQRSLSPDRAAPVFLLAFRLTREAAAQAVAEWIACQRLAPLGLKRHAAEHIAGVYLPVYLYSATAQSHYEASIGERLSEGTWRRESGGGGSRGGRDAMEYRELRGRHVTYLADVVITASRGVGNAELQAIEPFDWEALRHYSPAFVSGWSAEEASLSPEEGRRLAREEGQEAIRTELQRFMPGDCVGNLQPGTVFEEESLDLALVPVWVLAYRYHRRKPPLRVLVNGQTGKVSGALPRAWGRLAGITLAVVIVLAALFLAISFIIRIGL